MKAAFKFSTGKIIEVIPDELEYMVKWFNKMENDNKDSSGEFPLYENDIDEALYGSIQLNFMMSVDRKVDLNVKELKELKEWIEIIRTDKI